MTRANLASALVVLAASAVAWLIPTPAARTPDPVLTRMAVSTSCAYFHARPTGLSYDR